MSERANTETITDLSHELTEALDGLDNGRAYFDGLRLQSREYAAQAPTEAIEYATDMLMRDLVVAANNIGGAQTREAVGTTYDEIIAVANHLTGRSSEEANKPVAMIKLQAGFNGGTRRIREDSDPRDRAQLIDALMFANQELLTGDSRQAITAHTDQKYYVDNITAAVRHLESHS